MPLAVAARRPGPTRNRWVVVAAAVLVVVAGLVAGSNPVGDALYAVLVYVLVLVVAPRVPVGRAAALAFGICAAIELLQLTGWPAAVVDVVPVARYVLGTTFHAPDLLAYAVGVAVAAGADVLVSRRRPLRSPRSGPGRTPG